MLLVPILSDVRGISVVLKKWMRKNRLPDAIVIEHPRHAGGHLGATRSEDIADPRFDFKPVLEGTFALMHELGLEREQIPLGKPALRQCDTLRAELIEYFLTGRMPAALAGAAAATATAAHV